MILDVLSIQKYAALRLLQKYSKISGFCFKDNFDNFIDNINNARVLFEDNLRQFIVNYCQFMDIFGADATLHLGIAR